MTGDYQPQRYDTFEQAVAARLNRHLHNNWSAPFVDAEHGVRVLRRVCLEAECWYWLTTFETEGWVSRHA